MIGDDCYIYLRVCLCTVRTAFYMGLHIKKKIINKNEYRRQTTPCTMTANSSSNNENNSNKNAQKSSPLAPFLKSIGGDDCDRPACDDTKSALSAALERIGRASSSSSTSGEKTVKSSQVKGMSSDTTTFTAANDASVGYNACPPTRDEIGTSTWSLLHSMAAWYPNNPTPEDRHSISSFMTALAKFYPCTWCATDFQKNIELSPPRLV